jgi:hypothetical protein
MLTAVISYDHIMHTVIPYAAALGRHFAGPSSSMWPLLTVIFFSGTGSHAGSDIQIIGNGESAFTTHYSIHTVTKVSQGRDIALARNWMMRALKPGQLSTILSAGTVPLIA